MVAFRDLDPVAGWTRGKCRAMVEQRPERPGGGFSVVV
jgi:hypothetical protein